MGIKKINCSSAGNKSLIFHIYIKKALSLKDKVTSIVE